MIFERKRHVPNFLSFYNRKQTDNKHSQNIKFLCKHILDDYPSIL